MAVPMQKHTSTMSPLRPRNLNINISESRTRKAPISKCLFGVSDPDATNKLLQEQYRADRQRFFDRFGIDIDRLEQAGAENSPKKSRASENLKIPQDKLARQSRVLKPYNLQSKMTDFCQIKKPSHQPKKI